MQQELPCGELCIAGANDCTINMSVLRNSHYPGSVRIDSDVPPEYVSCEADNRVTGRQLRVIIHRCTCVQSGQTMWRIIIMFNSLG